MSLLIYTEKQTPRLDYILDFIFMEVIPCQYSQTQDIAFFRKSNLAKLNYSATPIENAIQITPHTLLLEDTIIPQNVDCFEWRNNLVFFKTNNTQIPFDIFSASFYLVTRYEEYIEKAKDEFERFPHERSIAFQNNFLNIPLVDKWLVALKEILLY